MSLFSVKAGLHTVRMCRSREDATCFGSLHPGPNTVDVILAVSIGARDSASDYRQKPVSNLIYQQGCRHNGNHVSRPARSERMHCRDEGCLRDLYRLQVLTVWHSSAQVFPLTRPCGCFVISKCAHYESGRHSCPGRTRLSYGAMMPADQQGRSRYRGAQRSRGESERRGCYGMHGQVKLKGRNFK